MCLIQLLLHRFLRPGDFFYCAGDYVVGHKWDGVSRWAQFDMAELNPSADGELQPAPGLGYYRKLDVGELFAEAKEYWKRLVERVKVKLPDERPDFVPAFLASAPASYAQLVGQ